MTGFLLDTNVISELRKIQPESRVVDFVSAQAENSLFLSDVTLAEIRYGCALVADVEKRASIEDWLENHLRALFAGRTLVVSEDTLFRWRMKIESGRRKGHSFGQPDLFIAVQAEQYDLIAVTRDTEHFVAASVATLNPWLHHFVDTTGGEHDVSDLSPSDLLPRLARLGRA